MKKHLESPVMGVDPGVTGGVAFVWPLTRRVLAIDIPSADGVVDVGMLAKHVREHQPMLAVVERASARPGQGVSSTFKYGAAYGALCALCALTSVPTMLVTPAKWKGHYRLNRDKEKARALAIRTWPGSQDFSRKCDHGRAEAALIAAYGLTLWK